MRNILFLCTGNSARSIMAEAYMNHAGEGVWRAFSAGSKPTGEPNPAALRLLSEKALLKTDAPEPQSKSWDVFASAESPVMNVVVTVCDNAAGEVCPVWPTDAGGTAPEKLHWSFPDPAAATGDDAAIRNAFETVFAGIKKKIDGFLETGRG
ncbi:MAG: arsenate reductase ArsC [Pseudomonadota bacterium]